MPESDRTTLLQLLLHQYEALCRQLARRLGSVDDATDALQDAWMKLRLAPALPEVHAPVPYLLTVAEHLASDRRRREARRRLQASEIADLLAPAEAAPEASLSGAEEIAALRDCLATLPARRRAIFLAARLKARPHREIAAEFGVSLRTVESEIRLALLACAAHLDRTVHPRGKS